MALLTLGVVLAVAFVARVGPEQVAAEFGRAGPNALWLLVPYAVGTAIGAAPWALLLPGEHRPTLSGVVLGRFAASSANAILPFFGLAGEPARLLWLSTEARARGFAAIVADRIVYNAANGVLLLAGAISAWLFTGLPRPVAGGAFAAGAAMLVVTALGLFAARYLGVGAKLQSLLRRGLRRARDASGFGTEVDAILAELVRKRRNALWVGAALHLVGRTAIALEVFVGLWILDAGAGPAAALVLAVVPIALSLVFSSVPSQIGVQEGAQTLVGAALGLNPAVVLALVLLQRFRQLVFVAALPLILATAHERASSSVRA